jgi:peptide/nickel transport system permease protein
MMHVTCSAPPRRGPDDLRHHRRGLHADPPGPGDPVQIMYAQSQGTTPEQLEAVRERLGLDRPLVEQYFTYLGRVLQGDLGVTIRGEQPVLELLLLRLPNTLLLAASALLIASAIG